MIAFALIFVCGIVVGALAAVSLSKHRHLPDEVPIPIVADPWRSKRCRNSITKPTVAEGDRILRNLGISYHIGGKLFLSSNPWNVDQFAAELRECGVTYVICLRPWDPLKSGGSDYLRRILQGSLPCAVELAPIEDGGVPTDFELFRINVKRWASALREGNNMLVHCGVGIGRTGMVACCIVVASGIAPARALELVNAAGSCPETPEQYALIYKLADAIVDRQRMPSRITVECVDPAPACRL